jgi:N-acetylmuramoyl-L-alanine amidase
LGLLRFAAVQRFRLRFGPALALTALFATLLCAQVNEEKATPEPRRQARSDSSSADEESPSPKPKSTKHKAKPQKSPSPTPATPKKKKTSDEEETPRPKPKASETPEATSAKSAEEPNQKPKPKATAKKSPAKKQGTPAKKKAGKKRPKAKESPEPERTPKSASSASPKPSETPSAQSPSGLPRAMPAATPAGPPAPASPNVTASPAEEPAQLTIEKTGYDQPRSFWSRLFGFGRGGGSGGFRYLNRAVRAEIDRAPADHRNPRWQMIVVHNSGTRQGNARVFDYYHRHVRHMQNGLAYHFVIGNGTSTGNGQIEVGDRWRRQINGGHVHSDNLNNIALGICLVGDFNRDQPTRAQLECCEELIRYLRQRCGKIENHYMVVKPHRAVNPPRWATDCPGDAFPYSWFRRFE